MIANFAARFRRTTAGLRFVPGFVLGMMLACAIAMCPTSAVASGLTAHAGALVQVGGSGIQPSHVAVDGSGNVFVTDLGNNRILEIVAVNGQVNVNSQVITLSSAASSPVGLAVAPNGDVLFTSLSGGSTALLYRLAAVNGSVPANSTPMLVKTIPVYALTVAVDTVGNVYTGAGTSLYQIAATGGVVSSSSTMTLVLNSFNNLTDIAFAPNGDLVVGDVAAETVSVVRAVSGSITSSSSIVTLATSLPIFSVAVDRQGDVYETPNKGTPVTEILAVNGVLSAGAAERSLSLTLDSGNGTAVDNNGNIFFADNGLGVMELQSPGQRLPPVAVGSTGSAQRIYFTIDTTGALDTTPYQVTSQGIASLDFNVAPTQPSTACVSGHTYNAGDLCTVDVMFAPQSPGTRWGAVQLYGSSGVIATAQITAIGTGPLPQFVPGTLTLFAGAAGSNGYISGMPGPATSVNLGQNEVVRTDAAGNTYVVDSDSCVLFKIDAGTGYTHILAGTVQSCDITGDGGQASSALLNYPGGLAIDGAGDIYVSEVGLNFAGTTFTNTVRRIDAVTGIITTVAGNKTRGYSGDGGPATSAAMNVPTALAVDTAGNLYIADQQNFAVRRVDAVTGIITTVAGNGSQGYSGDGGQAAAAEINIPDDIAFDSVGNLYIADGDNRVLREVNAATGIITTAAGNPSHAGNPYNTDGLPVSEANFAPLSLAIDAADNIYAGFGTPYIARIEAENQIVRHLAGNGITSDPTFGTPATSSGIGGNLSMTIDGSGNVIFVTGRQIAKITASSPTLTFATATRAGTTDTTDDPLSAIFSNIGNAPLVFTTPSTGSNPYITSPNWAPDSTNTCPITLSGNTATYLSGGQECIAAVDFTPKAAGSLTGSVVFADNALNVAGSQQTIALAGTGTAGLTISPASITFPSTAVGSTAAAMTATIANGGTSAIQLTTGSLTDATDFTQSDNCGGTVAAGSSCTVTFTFTPQSSGTLTSTYSVADVNNQGAPLTVALSGPATATYGLTISPASLVFSATTVGATSSSQTATLTLNGGSTRVNLTTGSLTDSTDFTQSDNCGGSITPNGSCVVTFTFTPKSSGALSSTYSIGLPGGSTPVTVMLSGTGTAPVPSLTPSTISFGSVVVGSTSGAINATLSNSGNAALPIQSITFASAGFAQTNNCGSNLAAGASCTIAVTCSPVATGLQSSTLDVNFPSVLPTQSASLSCTGTAPQAALSPGTSSFPSTKVGSTSTTTTFTLSNAGTAALSISSVSVTGANASSFAITSNGCGPSLAAGASCSVGVTFTPTAVGSMSATLSVTDAVGTQTAAMSGTGLSPTPPDFSLAASPAAQNSYRGQSVSYAIHLNSVDATNPFTAAVALTVTGLPPNATASFSPASVAPGATGESSTLTVTIAPLSGANHEPQWPRPRTPLTTTLATLGFAGLFGKRQRKTARKMPRLLLWLLLSTAAGSTLVGCGDGHGFAVPTQASTLTVTGTSGATTHTTTVTLTVQ